jgi:hypothetical protein
LHCDVKESQRLVNDKSILALEKLHWCSVCDPANSNWMNMPVWLSKMILAISAQFADNHHQMCYDDFMLQILRKPQT